MTLIDFFRYEIWDLTFKHRKSSCKVCGNYEQPHYVRSAHFAARLASWNFFASLTVVAFSLWVFLN